MNILYLAHRIPLPADKGDKLRSFRQLEYLARRHQVWCACFVDTPTDSQYVELLQAYCHDVVAIQLNRGQALLRGLGGLVRGSTVTESFYNHSAMRAALRRWSGSVAFDAVVAFSSSMAPYALEVPAGRRVLDMCDLDSQKWLDYGAASGGPAGWSYRAEGTRLGRRERLWLDVFDATIVITEAEAAPLRDEAPPGKLHIVGNGAVIPDLSEHKSFNGHGHGIAKWNAPSSSAPAGPDGPALLAGPLPWPTVGFVGVMDYRPNVDAVCWFVSNCWPEIRAACPEAVFRIVGKSPSRRVRRLARTAGVEVVGGVKDVTQEVRRFDVSVAPMRIARGLQNKVLEAMAAAKPVVLTSRAAEGIAARSGREYLVADGPQDIAKTVIRLLHDPAERLRVGRDARRFVAVNHCWEEVLRMFELIVTGVLERTALRVSLRRQVAARRKEEVMAPTAV